MTNLQSACQPDRKVRRDPPCTLGRPVPHFSETLPSTLPFPRKSPQDGKKGPPELVVPTGLAMSGRLDSNQRPPEPHSGKPASEKCGKPFISSTFNFLLILRIP